MKVFSGVSFMGAGTYDLGDVAIYAPPVDKLWLDVRCSVGKAQRDKGRRGQTAAEKILTARDWTVDPISAGIKREDLIAVDPSGVVWSVEVKNCINITTMHKRQAMDQAKARKLPWMIMSKIYGTKYWLVQRKGIAPVIWHETGMSDLI